MFGIATLLGVYRVQSSARAEGKPKSYASFPSPQTTVPAGGFQNGGNV
jgi:hypothetical protein